MSHPEQIAFVRLCKEKLIRSEDRSVIEIGSYNVNEADVGIRGIFDFAERYVGVDLTEGPGVDRVASGHEVDFPDASFDIAISCECFEHNPEWKGTFLNMVRMTRPGGLVIVTVASAARVEHGTSRTNPKSSPGTSAVKWNYYRNLSERDFRNAFDLDEIFSDFRFYFNRSANDLYFWGIKRGGTTTRNVDYEAFESAITQFWRGRAEIMTPIGYRLRVLSRIPLYVFHFFVPQSVFQTVAVFYTRVCYSVARRLGVKIDKPELSSASG
ncbi:MAG: class I SAM-dependent methyltransferase [Erythrobacter sp.]